MNEKEIKELFGIKPAMTRQQQKALHLAFAMLADELNGSGLEMNKLLKVDIPWTPGTVKEYLYRPIMKAMFNFDSTTELGTNQPSEVWDVLMNNLGEKKGVEYIPFPSEEQTKAYLNSFKK